MPEGEYVVAGCREMNVMIESRSCALDNPKRKHFLVAPVIAVIRRSKDVHSGSVGLPRLATNVRENAETRKPTREQARDPIDEGTVDLRQPSLAKPHHENA